MEFSHSLKVIPPQKPTVEGTIRVEFTLAEGFALYDLLCEISSDDEKIDILDFLYNELKDLFCHEEGIVYENRDEEIRVVTEKENVLEIARKAFLLKQGEKP